MWTAEPLGLEGARDEALRMGSDILAGQPSLMEDEAARLAYEHSALHWPIAFAEVFARDRPGFDVIVGNPPWDEVNVDELTFYSLHGPGLRGMPDGPRDAALAELKAERPELVDAFERHRANVQRLRAYFGPESGYEGTVGNADLYKFFCQRYGSLVRDAGSLGVVLPRGAFNAKGSTAFRDWLFREAPPRRIDFLLNRRRWAFDIHAQTAVGLLVSDRRRPVNDEEAYEVAGVAESAEEFAQQVEDARDSSWLGQP